jgi:tRNA (guanine-N7-)-methyltransferase
MGRRALRKVDPTINLSRHLLELQGPWSETDVFGRAAPLEVEVGSGKGLFLLRAATSNVDHNFLGIELAERYARHAAARLARGGLENARVAHGDALKVFREVLPSACAAAVHVYFPDPWWKQRHRKRRVMNELFLRDVERVLQGGGELHFWTDVAEYFDETLQLVSAVTQLQGPLCVDEAPAEHDLDYRTHFERRMRLNDEPVYRSRFRKRS